MYPFSSKPPIHLNFHITLSRVPFGVYSRTLLVIHFKHSSVYRLLPNSLTILPPVLPQPRNLQSLFLARFSTVTMMETQQSDGEKLISLLPYFPSDGSKYSFFYSFLPILPPPLSFPIHPFPCSFFCCCCFCSLSFSISFFYFCIKSVWTVISVNCPLRVLINNPLEIILFLFASVTQLYFIHVLLFWQINVSTAQQQTIDTSAVSSVF